MYPEVEQYAAAHKAAVTAYQEAVRALEAQGLEHGWGTNGKCPFCEARRPAWDARTLAIIAAFAALRDSADPLVRWIAEHCEDYETEALVILRALPAPMAELDALAREEAWCRTWETLKAKAREAGVLPAEAPSQGALLAQRHELDDPAEPPLAVALTPEASER